MSPSKKVNLFLVGAAKAGTTALQKNLSEHPEIYFSPIKEPHFFSSDIQPSNFRKEFAIRVDFDLKKYLSQKPLKSHHQAFIRDIAQYEMLFEEAESEKIIAEASASYLWSEVAAQRIFEYNPKAKILIVLRNPIERAFSHYLMDHRMGFEENSFVEAIEEDLIKPRFWGNANLYVDLGLYAAQVKRYMDTFPPEQLMIIFHEELKTDPKVLSDRLTKFLDIEDSDKFDLSQKHNAAKLPKNGMVGKLINSSAIQGIKSNKFVQALAPKISNLVFKKADLPELEDSEREAAYEYFKEDIRQLEGLILKELTHWKP